MTLFVGSILCMLASQVTAIFFSFRLKASNPDLHKHLDIYPWGRNPQFWVYYFMAPSKFRNLSQSEKYLATTSIALLSSGLGGLAVCVLDFVKHGAV